MIKFCCFLREHAKNVTNFEKKNISINKKRTKCNGMLHLQKKI